MSLLYLLLFGAGWKVSTVITEVPTEYCRDIGQRMVAEVMEQETQPEGLDSVGYLCVPVNPVIEERDDHVMTDDDDYRYDI